MTASSGPGRVRLRAGLWLALAAALLVRFPPIVLADREVADVARYRQVARHVLDVSPNPYETRRLYPYPPVWVWVEAGSEWLSRSTGLPFPVLVKLPVLLADLLIVALLGGRWFRERYGDWPAWCYALHPISILVTGFHGQFDSLAMLGVLLAIERLGRGRPRQSALALAGAVALKSFPVLLLPCLLASPALRGVAPRLRYALWAGAPVALLLLPFAWLDLAALRRELFGYGGVSDFGWIGLLRGVHWLDTGELLPGVPGAWPLLISVSKLCFLTVYAGIAAALLARRLVATPAAAALGVVLAFHVLYGAQSAQYLVWVAALGALGSRRYAVAHALAGGVALVGFYLFLAPGILTAAPLDPAGRHAAGWAWAVGVAGVWVVSVGWWGRILGEARRAAAGPGPG